MGACGPTPRRRRFRQPLIDSELPGRPGTVGLMRMQHIIGEPADASLVALARGFSHRACGMPTTRCHHESASARGEQSQALKEAARVACLPRATAERLL